MSDAKAEPSMIYVTQFKNQFDEWQVFHAFRSKTRALADVGSSGKLIETVELYEYQALQSELANLKAEKKILRDALEFYATGKHWCLRPMIGETIYDKGHIAREALEKTKGEG